VICTHFFDVVKSKIDGVPCEVATCRKCGQVDRYDYVPYRGIGQSDITSRKRTTIQPGREPEEVNMSETTNKARRTPSWRHREIEAHYEEIRADLLRLGLKRTRAKWGIGSGTIYRLINSWLSDQERALIPTYVQSLQRELEREPVEPEAQEPLATSPTTPTLPGWNEAWVPEVQAEWLRAYQVKMGPVSITVAVEGA